MAWTTVPVTGQELGADGGTVTFELTAHLVNPTLLQNVPRRRLTYKLDSDGRLEAGAVLYATDEPGVQPEGVAWQVTVRDIPDLVEPKVAFLNVPYTASSVDLSSAVPQRPIATVEAGATTGYVDSVAASRVLRAGDTMTGPLTVVTPTAPLHAAPKRYVDRRPAKEAAIGTRMAWDRFDRSDRWLLGDTAPSGHIYLQQGLQKPYLKDHTYRCWGAAGTPTYPVALDAATDTVTWVAHGLTNNRAVRFTALPNGTGLTADSGSTPGTRYYTINVTADTFQLALDQTVGVTLDATTNIVTWTAHGLSNGTRVVFTRVPTGSGLTKGITYFVVAATADTFQVAATAGGAAIDILAVGITNIGVPIDLAAGGTATITGAWGGFSFILIDHQDQQYTTHSTKGVFVPGPFGSSRTQEILLIASAVKPTLSAMSVQLRMMLDRWDLFVFDVAGPTGARDFTIGGVANGAGGTWDVPLLEDGVTEYACSMSIDRARSEVTVRLPDNSVRTFYDPRFATPTFWDVQAGVQLLRGTNSGDVYCTEVQTSGVVVPEAGTSPARVLSIPDSVSYASTAAPDADLGVVVTGRAFIEPAVWDNGTDQTIISQWAASKQAVAFGLVNGGTNGKLHISVSQTGAETTGTSITSSVTHGIGSGGRWVAWRYDTDTGLGTFYLGGTDYLADPNSGGPFDPLAGTWVPLGSAVAAGIGPGLLYSSPDEVRIGNRHTPTTLPMVGVVRIAEIWSDGIEWAGQDYRTAGGAGPADQVWAAHGSAQFIQSQDSIYGLTASLDSLGGFARGRTKIGAGGAVQYGVPGVELGTVTTQALAVNTDRVTWFENPGGNAITVDQVAFEVTTGPAVDGHLRYSVYAADTDMQPSGSALFEGEVAVAAAFTGKKTATVAAVVLPPGQYCRVVNVDQAMTLRALTGGSRLGGIQTNIGATPFVAAGTVARTYGAFTTATPWTATDALATPPRHTVFLRWTP